MIDDRLVLIELGMFRNFDDDGFNLWFNLGILIEFQYCILNLSMELWMTDVFLLITVCCSKFLTVFGFEMICEVRGCLGNSTKWASALASCYFFAFFSCPDDRQELNGVDLDDMIAQSF